MSATLWFDRGRRHVWRVPDDVDLPPGHQEILSFDGAVARVDPAALTPWLLEKGQARQAILDDLSGAARHAGRALTGVAAGWWAEARASLPEDSQPQGRVQQGREAVEQAAREARATWKRAARVARSAATSGWAVGKVVLENPEIAETASRIASAMAGAKKKP